MTSPTDLARTEAEKLLVCPFCGSEIKHVESWARSFNPARMYHEYHHPNNGCLLSRPAIIAACSDDPLQRQNFITEWNTREPVAQALVALMVERNAARTAAIAEVEERLRRIGMWSEDDAALRVVKTAIEAMRENGCIPNIALDAEWNKAMAMAAKLMDDHGFFNGASEQAGELIRALRRPDAPAKPETSGEDGKSFGGDIGTAPLYPSQATPTIKELRAKVVEAAKELEDCTDGLSSEAAYAKLSHAVQGLQSKERDLG